MSFHSTEYYALWGQHQQLKALNEVDHQGILPDGLLDPLAVFFVQARQFFQNIRARFDVPRRDPYKPNPQVSALLSSVGYSNARTITIYVPDGFTGLMVDYLKGTEPALAMGQTFVPSTLIPFKAFAASLLAHPEQLGNERPFVALERVVFHKDLIRLHQEHYNSFIASANHMGNELPFGSVYQSVRQFDEVTALLATLSKQAHNINQAQALRDVQQINELMDRLLSRVEANAQKYQITTSRMMELAEVTQQVAFEVDFLAGLINSIYLVEESMQATENRLLTLLN